MTSNKKISAFCAEQVLRLGGQDFFTANEIVLAELIRTLIHYAESESHIERMVTVWIDGTRQMLHPSQVAALADQTTIRPKLAGCSQCGGTGWKHTTRVVTRAYDEMTVETYTEECVARCDCEKGRKLAAIDNAKPVQTNLGDVLAAYSKRETVN